MRPIGLLTGIRVERVVGRNRALAREWLKFRQRVCALLIQIRLFVGPMNVCRQHQKVQATLKSMNAYNRVRFGSLTDAPVAGPGMRPVNMN